MDLNPNKKLKEEFVSNLSGSSMLEIAALSTIVPALIVLRKWISSGRRNVHAQESNLGIHLFDMVLDYTFVILPILLFFTVLADWCYPFTILLIFLISLMIAYNRLRFISRVDNNPFSLRTVLSSYRVSVVVVTCLCILAVDFKIFPRRYAKTETYGTSLMDLGVGSFVVTNAIVSKQARDLSSVNLMASLKSIGPLIFLGFFRLISTRGVDYQVHEAEYGVHWNFFFTLGAVSILASLFHIRPKYCGILGLFILSGYQMVLKFGFNDYLISSEREDNLISQNKEGIFSIFGYWGMYLIGVYFGNQLLVTNGSSRKNNIWGLSALFWFLTIILDHYVERVSRRMCNMAYVTNVFAQNFQVLSILTLADTNLVLEDAFNQNLLGSFILANILTGMVNMSMDKSYSASSLVALPILVGYSFILCFVVTIASFYRIRFKFW